MRVNMPQNRKKAGFFMADMLGQISKKPSAKISKILWVLWEIQTDMVTSGLLDCKKKRKKLLKTSICLVDKQCFSFAQVHIVRVIFHSNSVVQEA